jgi:DNA-binding IclR family transcriptional regulator
MLDRDPRAGSASTDRSLLVLETLVSSTEPITLTELARRCGVPLATCSAIAASLEARGYAQRTIVGRSHLWRPTLKLYGLGMLTLRRVELGDESEPILNKLRDQVDLPAHLGVLEGASVVYVAKAATSAMVQFNTYPGRISPYNQTALGKAIAAFSPEHRREELLTLAVPGAGPNAARGTRRRLREEFSVIRDHGFAVENQEEEAGIACIAAPVLGGDGFAVAAIGVTGLEHQLLRERRPTITQAVVHAAGALARRTGLRGAEASV